MKNQKLKMTTGIRKLVNQKVKQYTAEYFDNSYTLIGKEIQSNIECYQFQFDTYNFTVKEQRKNIEKEYEDLHLKNSVFNYSYCNSVSQKGDLLQAIQLFRKYWLIETDLQKQEKTLREDQVRHENFLRELDPSNYSYLLESKFVDDGSFWQQVAILFDKAFRKKMFCAGIITLVLELFCFAVIDLSPAILVYYVLIASLWFVMGIFVKPSKDANLKIRENVTRVISCALKSDNYRSFKGKAKEKVSALEALEQWRKGKTLSSPDLLLPTVPITILPREYMDIHYITLAENSLVTGRCETMKEIIIYLEQEKYKAEQLTIQKMMLAEQQRANDENIRIAKERAEQERINHEEMLRAANEQRRSVEQANAKLLAEQKKANALAKQMAKKN